MTERKEHREHKEIRGKNPVLLFAFFALSAVFALRPRSLRDAEDLVGEDQVRVRDLIRIGGEDAYAAGQIPHQLRL